MICNKCGMQNNEGSKFCIGCGNPLSVIPESIINNTNNIQNLNSEPVENNANIQMNQVISAQPIANNVSEQSINNTVVNKPVTNLNNKEKKPINKKLLFIIGASLLCVIIVILLFLFVFKGNKVSKDLSSIFDLEQPIPVRKDGSYVYIDTSGKIIKNIKYNEANDFNGDYAFVELEDGTAALIDKKQNVKVSATSYYGMEYLSTYDLWLIDGVLYNNKLKAITDNSISLTYLESGFFKYNNSDYTEYGIINNEGKRIYKNSCLVDSLDINYYNDEYYAVLETTCYEGEVETKKEYLISLQTGTILYENEYKETHPDSYYYYLLQTDDNNMFYIVDENYDKIKYFYLKGDKIAYKSDETLYDLELYGEDYLQLDYGYSYEEKGKEQRYYYYNLEAKKIEKEEPELEDIDIKIEKDVTERQIVSCSNGKGLIDDKNVIIPCIYNDIEYLEDNVHEYMKSQKSMDLMIVEDDNEQISIYDSNDRKEIIKFEKSENSDIIDHENSLLIEQKIYVDDSWFSDLEKTVVYNLLTKEKIVFDAKSDIEIKSNYFTENKNGKKIYYNMNFEKIYTEG